MMRLIIPTILLLLAGCSDSEKKENNGFKTEQLYKGYSDRGSYLCYLKILPGNKVVFTYQNEGNDSYGEHSGTIKAINDSTYRVNCKLTFGQFVYKPLNLDSLWISIDPPSLIDKKMILACYENEDQMTGRKTSKSGITFAIDDRLFNDYTPAYILTDHTHPITGEALTIKASYGCAYSFVEGDQVGFDIVISGDSLYTIGDDAVLQTGPFRLKKEKF
jgi:hypothetical protein